MDLRKRFGFVLITAFGCMILCSTSAIGQVYPDGSWQDRTPDEMGLVEAKLGQARDYALRGQGSGCVIYKGYRVWKWGDQNTRYDLKSTTKSFGITALGLALMDGKISSLHEPAQKFHPSLCVPPESNRSTGWIEKMTLFHLATQSAGIAKPGGYHKMLFEPGTQWSYSDAGPNWLAECLVLIYKQDLNELMFERVFEPIGISPDDLFWRKNQYRDHKLNGLWRREFGSGIHANVDAMARFGTLYLRQGQWQGEQIVSAEFIGQVRTVPDQIKGLEVVEPESYFNASDHYGFLWWNNADGSMKDVPRDAYWSWGLYDSLIVVVPSLDLVIARAGKSLNPKRNAAYGAIEPFITPIVQAIKSDGDMSEASPYLPSESMTTINWAPKKSIIRLARGGDNWPVTWADDGPLYTAYGDGWGFEPRVEKKLSLGIAKVTGSPAHVKGINIRSESGERMGQGAAGAKASGMLMVDGVLYMLVRNTGNSQLAWSQDRGEHWQWSQWRFEKSFGAPTFLNFGKNYSDARDEYVYIYSHDHDSAYEPGDRMVMARVAKARLKEKDQYEFFAGLDPTGRPLWTRDIEMRASVFDHKGKCYRHGISYNPGVQRYMWCQVIPGEDTRFEGGFGIYEAPEPWGPWRTVYYTERWDVGPGETCSIPPKWLSQNGQTGWLVFSGDDCFSLRKFTVHMKPK
jgi:CubicO group peptidase (beta-lactamase class C family)